METDKKALLVRAILIFITICFVVIFIVEFVKADIIIIDDPNTDPFNVTNSTNVTAINNTHTLTQGEIDALIKEYLGENNISYNDKLISELINLSTSNREERVLLDSVLRLTQNNQRQFTDALSKMDYALGDARSQRDNATQQLSSLTQQYTARFETLNTELETLRIDNSKFKGLVYFYIILGLVIGVLAIEIANYLKHNQKAYFVLRAIRDKIPIKI